MATTRQSKAAVRSDSLFISHEDIDVVVVGDEAENLVSLLAVGNEVQTSYLGIRRVSQLHVGVNYWIRVNFITFEDVLMHPYIINSVTKPYQIVLCTFTWNDNESLERARELARLFICDDPWMKYKKSSPRAQNIPDDAENTDIVPIGYGCLVAVNSNTQSGQCPVKLSRKLAPGERDPRLPESAYDIKVSFRVPPKYVGQDAIKLGGFEIYRWILRIYCTIHRDTSLTPGQIGMFLRSLVVSPQTPEPGSCSVT